jgi:hypothetical protein
MPVPELRLTSVEPIRLMSNFAAPTVELDAPLGEIPFITPWAPHTNLISPWSAASDYSLDNCLGSPYTETLDLNANMNVVGDLSAAELLRWWAPLVTAYGPSPTGVKSRHPPMWRVIAGIRNLRRRRVHRDHKARGRALARCPQAVQSLNESCDGRAVVRESTGSMTVWSANAPPAAVGA